MKRYKLLKDLPTIKAGEIFKETVTGYNEKNLLVRIAPLNAKSPRLKVQDIDNFDEWFEEIQEPIDSIHWKPKQNEKIWYLDENGDTNFTYFDKDNPYHLRRIEFGNAYCTSEECEKARSRKFAEARLRQTSTFEPDFENGKGGWIVGYDHCLKELTYDSIDCTDYGEPVRYETEEDALKSIKENERDWKIYFGIEEER